MKNLPENFPGGVAARRRFVALGVNSAAEAVSCPRRCVQPGDCDNLGGIVGDCHAAGVHTEPVEVAARNDTPSGESALRPKHSPPANREIAYPFGAQVTPFGGSQ